MANSKRDTKRLPGGLTRSQLEIVIQRAKGVCFKEIAFERGVSLKTVEWHWARIKERLGRQDVVAICRWVWERGLA